MANARCAVGWVLLLAGCLPEPDSSALEARLAAMEEAQSALTEELGNAQLALDDATQQIDALRAEVDDLNAERLSYIRVFDGDETLEVPGEFATIQAALAYLDGFSIPSDVDVTIQLDNGRYDFTEPLEIDHPDGQHIRIVGNDQDPALVELFFAGCDGVVVSDHRALGLIDGVTIQGDGTASTNGLMARDGSLIKLGQNVVVEEFGGAGIYAYRWSAVIAPSNSGLGARARRNNDGFAASMASFLYGVGFTSDANGDIGFQAQFGSFASATDSTAQDDGVLGYYARAHSLMRMDRATTTRLLGTGAEAEMASTLFAPNARLNDSLGYGVIVHYGGFAWLSGAEMADNGRDGVRANIGGFAAIPDASISGNDDNAATASWGGTVYVNTASLSGTTSPSSYSTELTGSYLYR